MKSWRRPDSAYPNRTLQDRGASMLLLVGALGVLLAIASVAVDISAFAVSGQRLQNAADAAALAGAVEWASGNTTQVEDVIESIIAQNGLDPNVVINVSYPTEQAVTVEIIDLAPTQLLPFAGVFDDIRRSATAEHRACDDACEGEFELPPPLGAIAATGNGDGFLPIAVGSRLYSVNHHSGTMSCVDITTQAQCWTERQAFTYSGLTTTDVHHPYLLGTKIYFLGHTVGRDWAAVPTGTLYLGCWETITDMPCSTILDLGQQGHATLAGVNSELYVLTNSRKVFCFNPALGASANLEFADTCSGYSTSGNYSALTTDPNWSTEATVSWTADQRSYDNKIYHSISNAGEVWIQCWDIAVQATCASFGVQRVDETTLGSGDWAVQSRLFFGRETDGTPRSICSFGELTVSCFRLSDGGTDAYMNGQLAALRAEMLTFDAWFDQWAQMASYHAPTNRLFLAAPRYNNTFCFDFDTAQKCAPISAVENMTALGIAQPYGYISGGDDCLIGLGHRSIFFSIKPDLSGPCTQANGSFVVEPCGCTGDIAWPAAEVQNIAELSLLDVRVISPSGLPLAVPNSDVDGFVDLLTYELNLASVGQHSFVTIEYRADATPGYTPWQGSTVPTFVFERANSWLRLID